jgi:hypothetical protein
MKLFRPVAGKEKVNLILSDLPDIGDDIFKKYGIIVYRPEFQYGLGINIIWNANYSDEEKLILFILNYSNMIIKII